ncbi:MAG: hypothetical protein ACLQQ4_09645 [Bacteroidia bacterium]
MTPITKKYSVFFFGILVFLAGNIYAQSKSSTYLFHFQPFQQVQPQSPQHGRRVKVRFDYGLVHQFYNTDPNYTSGTTGTGAYTLGLKLEIPILKNSALLVGADFMHEHFDFITYYFAPGLPFLYIPANMIYKDSLELDELQIPVLVKLNFTSETRNTGNFYCTFGWAFRYLFYDNALIENGVNGKFVWEGQYDITSAFHFIVPQGSGIVEASLGYQHNYLKNGNAWFFEIEYKYGVSPFLYVGNNTVPNNSNNILFTLNTLAFKFGLRL